MSTTDLSSTVSMPLQRRSAASAVGALLALELVVLVVYLRATGTELLAVRYTLYPFVWINVAAWVLLRRPTVETDRSRRRFAAALALGYFVVLAAAGGLIQSSGMAMPLDVTWLSPGWGPLVTYANGWVHLSVVPFEVVGYLALAALVYTIVLAGARSALAGVLGIATCVGCVWPVGAAAVAALGGVGAPLATAVPSVAYDISTVLFLLTAGTLHWAAHRTTRTNGT